MSQAIQHFSTRSRGADSFSTALPENLPPHLTEPKMCTDLRAYDTIAHDPKYRHFVRIPERIIHCLDYFRIAGNRVAVRRVLHAYYVFIGVVDNAIDSGELGIGSVVLYHFERRTPVIGESTISDVTLMTEVLKCHISDDVYLLMLSKLRKLYQEVVSERTATSIELYIEQRKAVGRLTAELSYLLIRPLLAGEHENLRDFMQQVGAVGCIIDSIIDLNADRRLGLLSFKPTIKCYAKLTCCALLDGLRLASKHPRLSGLFFQAIIDNVRDRFGRQQGTALCSIVSDRKDQAPSVA